MIHAWFRPRVRHKARRTAPPSRRRTGAAPILEGLEGRVVPATLDLTGGVLSFTAADGETNDVRVEFVTLASVPYLRIRDLGPGVTITTSGGGLTLDSPNSARAQASSVTELAIRAGDMVDEVSLPLDGPLPPQVVVLALDPVATDRLSVSGTPADDVIGVTPYRFPGDFNNTSPNPEDGQKGFEIRRGAASIKTVGIRDLAFDISQDGNDTISVDRYLTSVDHILSLDVIGGGVGRDALAITGAGDPAHPQALPQAVTLTDGSVTIDDNLAGTEVILGPSDNIAIDQPKAVIELLDTTQIDANGDPASLGPQYFNTFLLDTGASGILAAAEATGELLDAGYRTEGIYLEQGVAGYTQFDVSAEYRVDFAGDSGERNTLDPIRIQSSENVSFSFFGPWGIIGMPAMVNRVVTIDMSRWSDIQDLLTDLSIRTDFGMDPAPVTTHTADVPLSLVDFPADGAVPGNPIPTFAPLPHIPVTLRDQGREVSGEFLVDTGAQLSIISTETALALGLDRDGDGNLDHEALGGVEVGGIGGSVIMPILAVDRLAVPTSRGDQLVWTNLLVGVLDIEVTDGPKLDGVFGMDFLTSGWAAKVLPQLDFSGTDTSDVPDGFFQKLYFDFRDAANHNGKLTFDLSEVRDNPAPANPNRMSITYSGLDEVRVTTGSGDDTVNVTPSTSVRYVLDAGPHASGDSLAVDVPNGLTASNDGSKIQVANRQDIVYSRFESVNVPQGDTTPPAVTSVAAVAPNPRTTPVSTADVTFSEPIDLATFDFNDLALTRGGAAVPLSATVTTALVSGSTYRIAGLDGFTASPGAYVLTVSATGVKDLAGNLGTGSGSTGWTTNAAATAVFVGSDTTHQGDWKQVSGKDGYQVLGDSAVYPAYASVTASNYGAWTWASSTSDPRGLIKPSSTTGDRIASTFYSGTAFNVQVTTNDAPHKVSFYFLDWDNQGRSQRVDVLDSAGNVLDTRDASDFSAGTYMTWTIQGDVTFRVSRLGGPNAVMSGLFFGEKLGSATATAQHVKDDAATQGDWKSAYGVDGFSIINDPSANNPSLPSYATLAVTGGGTHAWNGSTNDPRALKKADPNAADRLAACWYSSGALSLNVKITDGQTHQVALYLLDWDNNGRNMIVDVVDTGTGAALEASRAVSGFGSGVYLVYNISGDVTFRLSNNGSSNAVLSGVFFGGAPQASSTASYLGADATTQGNWKGAYGLDGGNVIGDAASYPAYAAVAAAGQNQTVWNGWTNDPRALQKTSSSASDRIAGCWYTSNAMIIDVNLTDNQAHKVSLYLLDWDDKSRAETVEIIDADSGLVLDSRTASSFQDGTYLSWSIKGHVKIRVTLAGGPNAVVSGLFFN